MSPLRLLRYLAATLLVVAMTSPAQAQSMGLDAQIRAHAGISAVSSPGMVGVTAGLDSRLGRLVYVDFSAFASLGNPDVEPDYDEEPRDAFRLRHGITLTPGLRVPHRQPETFRWDVLLRAGPSVIWTVYDGPRASGVTDQVWEIDTAIVAGPDLLVVKGPYGVRVSGRIFLAQSYSRQIRDDVLIWMPLITVEASYQFQGIVRDRWRDFNKGR